MISRKITLSLEEDESVLVERVARAIKPEAWASDHPSCPTVDEITEFHRVRQLSIYAARRVLSDLASCALEVRDEPQPSEEPKDGEVLYLLHGNCDYHQMAKVLPTLRDARRELICWLTDSGTLDDPDCPSWRNWRALGEWIDAAYEHGKWKGLEITTMVRSDGQWVEAVAPEEPLMMILSDEEVCAMALRQDSGLAFMNRHPFLARAYLDAEYCQRNNDEPLVLAGLVSSPEDLGLAEDLKPL